MLCFCSDCVIVGAMNIHKSIDTLIGNTPLVELVRIKERYGFAATLAVKIEFLNPGGSVKDRAALFMLEEAEKKRNASRRFGFNRTYQRQYRNRFGGPVRP